ncbi:hypothetical protein F2Q70_00038620 [Brassica cretica]|uniref:RNase H type-1 domain-containing protein n=1 Tax=Brassica cretica TaxID=69181 RepID=A0A8S9MG09_BRACR|nr:hypothetical protein F2Q70_00038620 [Brassica cretica]KAF2617962.1 hypothetical protein F2Q68_00039264 [Brassica cretica]
METGTKAIIAAKEWGNFQVKQQKRPTAQRPQPILPPECAIIRSDAAWQTETMMAGLGWTINSLNRTSSFSVPEQAVRSPLTAEGLALREAVMMCKKLKIPKICCESDLMQLIQAVNSISTHSELYSIVADIHSCLSSFEFCIFRWIPRLGNLDADNLAKSALADAVVVMALT